jgi:hypothetical protein
MAPFTRCHFYLRCYPFHTIAHGINHSNLPDQKKYSSDNGCYSSDSQIPLQTELDLSTET